MQAQAVFTRACDGCGHGAGVHGERPVTETELRVDDTVCPQEVPMPPAIALDARTAGFAEAGMQYDLPIAPQPGLLTSVIFLRLDTEWLTCRYLG